MEEPARPWMDRYRSLLEELNAHEVSLKLKRIEAALWQGLPGRPSLFSEELAEVRARGEKHRGEKSESPPDLLVLCVGYSPEPLLLAVAHDQPAEVVLLKAPNLQGEYLDLLEKLWKGHGPALGLPGFPPPGQGQRVVEDEPQALFLAIHDLVESRPGARIVLDITGAKKSMIAGAFLAAGLLEVETSYVDFSAYDRILRRPMPGTSTPGRLKQPYRTFMLREQGRLETEFDRGNYREAAKLAEALGTLDIPWASKFLRIQGLATAYGHWKEGFYQEAAEALAACPAVPRPPAIDLLKSTWPRADQPPKEIVRELSQKEVFADPAVPLAYFVDVLAWSTEQRIAEQPRDVYLRLYGTLESLVFFAFHTFVTRDSDRLQIDPPAEDPALRERILDACETNSTACLKILGGKKARIELRSGEPWTGEVSWPEPILPRESVKLLEGQWSFTELRHKAVHWLAPVPRQQARELLIYFQKVLQNLVPAVTAQLRKSAGLDGLTLQRMDDWERRLLSAAGGEVPEDCKPLTYREAENRIRP